MSSPSKLYETQRAETSMVGESFGLHATAGGAPSSPCSILILRGSLRCAGSTGVPTDAPWLHDNCTNKARLDYRQNLNDKKFMGAGPKPTVARFA